MINQVNGYSNYNQPAFQHHYAQTRPLGTPHSQMRNPYYNAEAYLRAFPFMPPPGYYGPNFRPERQPFAKNNMTANYYTPQQLSPDGRVMQDYYNQRQAEIDAQIVMPW